MHVSSCALWRYKSQGEDGKNLFLFSEEWKIKCTVPPSTCPDIKTQSISPNKAQWRRWERNQTEKPNFLLQRCCNPSSPFMPSLAYGHFSPSWKGRKALCAKVSRLPGQGHARVPAASDLIRIRGQCIRRSHTLYVISLDFSQEVLVHVWGLPHCSAQTTQSCLNIILPLIDASIAADQLFRPHGLADSTCR